MIFITSRYRDSHSFISSLMTTISFRTLMLLLISTVILSYQFFTMSGSLSISAMQPQLVSLLAPLSDQPQSVYGLLGKLEAKVSHNSITSIPCG